MTSSGNRPRASSMPRAGNWTGLRNTWERSPEPNMLSQSERTAILELSAKKVGTREIARALKLSRWAVRKVIRLNSSAIPEIERAEKAEPYRAQILELLDTCKGNLVRVHEELMAQGAELSYQALTAFCRRHGIGQTPPTPVGQYHFEPGEEAQHDTSPHTVEVGGKKYAAQTASAVLYYTTKSLFSSRGAIILSRRLLELVQLVEGGFDCCQDSHEDDATGIGDVIPVGARHFLNQSVRTE